MRQLGVQVAGLLATLAVMYGSAVATAEPAAAGGPTSVLVSGDDGVAAFGYDDPRYRALFEQLEAIQVPVAESTGPAVDGPAAGSGRFSLVWLIHDRSVWRVDVVRRVNDDLWIASTVALDGATSIDSAQTVQHRSKHPGQLLTLLESLPLTGRDRQAQPEALPPPIPSPQPGSAPVVQDTGSVSLRPGMAALLGLTALLGGGIGLVVGHALQRHRAYGRRRIRSVPRIELVDIPGTDDPRAVGDPRAG